MCHYNNWHTPHWQRGGRENKIKKEKKKKGKKKKKFLSFLFPLVSSLGISLGIRCASFSIVTLLWVLLIPCRVPIVKCLSHKVSKWCSGFFKVWRVAIAGIQGRLTAGQQISHASSVSNRFNSVGTNPTGSHDRFSCDCQCDCASLRGGFIMGGLLIRSCRFWKF